MSRAFVNVCGVLYVVVCMFVKDLFALPTRKLMLHGLGYNILRYDVTYQLVVMVQVHGVARSNLSLRYTKSVNVRCDVSIIWLFGVALF